jgi:hypothetical protein
MLLKKVTRKNEMKNRHEKMTRRFGTWKILGSLIGEDASYIHTCENCEKQKKRSFRKSGRKVRDLEKEI